MHDRKTFAEDAAQRAHDARAQVDRLNAVGILAASLIHELLQPLSAAGFYCHAAAQLAAGPHADPQRLLDVIARIDTQIQRTGDIVERLRSFLRGRAMHRAAVPVDRICCRALDLAHWFAADRAVALRLEMPDELPDILTDPVQVEQVLVNLICNAVQAIDGADLERREITVAVALGSDTVEFVVRDTGPGLPPDRHDASFDLFESTHDSSLGLGLAISRAIAEALGGRLWAESHPAEGAVFHFALPLAGV